MTNSCPMTSGIKVWFESLVTWRRIIMMASQGAEASKVLEVSKERGRWKIPGDARKKRRSKALSPTSREVFTAYEARLAKLKLAMGNVYEQLDTLDFQMEEQKDRCGNIEKLEGKHKGALNFFIANMHKAIRDFQMSIVTKVSAMEVELNQVNRKGDAKANTTTKGSVSKTFKYVTVKIKGVSTYALLDSGANQNLIVVSFMKELGLPYTKEPAKMVAYTSRTRISVMRCPWSGYLLETMSSQLYKYLKASNEIGKARWFSKLDLRLRYLQVRIVEGEEVKTTCVMCYGAYEFLVTPFNLTNAHATFCTLRNKVVHPFLDKFMVVYLDNAVVYSEMLEEHDLKQAVTKELLPSLPDYGKPFEEQIGMFDFAIKGVLMQDGHTIAFESHKLNDTEKWYSVHDKQMIVIVHCLWVWHHYFLRSMFVIKMDNVTMSYF
ncbi:hypothetical protein SLEP1_g16606 [Rubroshorea leprosula]|uniref:Reverse transcriptase/retrotransposon-derived protein RNase H-like domain-containing protein n=1 Tax=Rubroshorea leprosula TaxID=152421 RepID=A0AAV5IX94_9ROSI|nr:hypothetical protein SLEP1_g16606 [Rubroshorea leprosula]